MKAPCYSYLISSKAGSCISHLGHQVLMYLYVYVMTSKGGYQPPPYG